MRDSFTVWAPGRVNLIGDHTDYTGGLAMPMAIDLGITLTGERGVDRAAESSGRRVALRSSDLPGELTFAVPTAPSSAEEIARIEPGWGRYVAAVASEMVASGMEPSGFTGSIHSTLPVASGLSSSAALEVAAALALGAIGTPVEIAELCQRAERLASGVPCGVMDQLAIASGVEGQALMIDCHALRVIPVPMPPDATITVLHSGRSRELAGSAYAERRDQCATAEAIIGPLRLASPEALATIDDEVVRRRARHVIGENARVRSFADAMRRGDLASAGEVMVESHRSLALDFDVSTPELDHLVDSLIATPGVHGARLTGAGFGGCVVALSDPEVELTGPAGVWRVRPSTAAHRMG